MITDEPKLDIPLRMLMRVGGLLTKLGLVPSIEQVCKMPVAKRKTYPGEGWVNGAMPRNVAIVRRRIPVRHGSIAARIYEYADPAERRPMVLYIHGGGWVFGGLTYVNRLCAQLASASGALVLSVDYRLAPECPHPASLDDCTDVLTWLSEHGADLGGDRDAVVVMGDSAGGNLAAALALRSRDEGGPAIALQALIYPALDATLRSPSMNRRSAAMDLSRDEVAMLLRHYLEGADPTNPLVSPVLAPDLSRLPAALIITADCDVLRDEGRRYAERLADSGVSVRYSNYLGMPHGFITSPRLCRSAPQARAELAYEVAELARKSRVSNGHAGL